MACRVSDYRHGREVTCDRCGGPIGPLQPRELELRRAKGPVLCTECAAEVDEGVEIVPGHQSARFASERQEKRGLK